MVVGTVLFFLVNWTKMDYESKRREQIRKQKLKEDKETLTLMKRGMLRCNSITTRVTLVDQKLILLFGERKSW